MPILKRSKVLTAMPLFYAFDRKSPFMRTPRLPSIARYSALPLILYQRDDCHLCDLALEVLARARVPEFESVFIEDDATLEERYGMRVPVLRDDGTGAELDWPFDEATLRFFVAPLPPVPHEGVQG